jgi:hypothetical protein
LSTILPNTLASKVAFLLTNASEPLYQNFPGDTVPGVLKLAPQFLLNNPIALQKKHLELRDDPKTKNRRREIRKMMKDAEQSALEMLVDLFDWLDGVEPQPTT